MLKLPSVQRLVSGALHTLKRFPMVLLCAVAGAALAIYLADHHRDELSYETTLIHLLIAASLGLTLFLSIAMFSEARRLAPRATLILNAGGFLLLTAYFFSLPDKFEQIEVYRYLLFNAGLHLLVSFSPFIGRGSINGFWQFNKTFFLRILLSALYTVVLYLGLALAMLAVDNLFAIRIGSESYFRLWIVLAAVFNTWFFLSGIPADISTLNDDHSYPKGLKLFTQYVLLPLVTIYMLILYAYLVKILVTWRLPKGWVSYLVLGFSVAGILSLLLIYPIRNNEDNNWIRVFSRWFYRALYPLIALLLVAICTRITEYGITENRYYILVLAVWLACIAAYFLLSEVKNIRVIPVSLCLIAFLSSFGPLSSFSISRRSQLHRLEELLVADHILVDGIIQKKHAKIPYKDNARISSILEYLDQTHGLYVLQPWFREPMDSVFKSGNNYAYKLGGVHHAMGLQYVSRYYNEENYTEDLPFYYYRLENTYRGYKYIGGFDYMLNLNLYNPGSQSIALGTDSIHFTLDTICNTVTIRRNRSEGLSLSLEPIFTHADSTATGDDYNSKSIDAMYMNVTGSANGIRARLDVSSLNGKVRKTVRSLNSVYGELYFTLQDSARSSK